MELMDTLKLRRAVRDYRSSNLSHSVIEGLVEAAILAPSAFNLQPWAFAALLDPVRIDSYAERAKEWLLANPAQNSFGEGVHHNLKKPGFSIFYHAPALIIVMALSSVAQAAEDCCMAAQNLMLAARDQGIGSCCIGLARAWLNLPSTKRELALPESHLVIAPIVLGYPRAWPESPGRKQPELHWL